MGGVADVPEMDTKSNIRGKASKATQQTEHLASTMTWCGKILFNTPN